MIVSYTIPDYYTEFTCTMCGLCCKGWSVYVDNDRLDSILSVNEYKENIEVVPHGKIKFIDGECSFLEPLDLSSNIQLCKIHKNLGEASLPSTCDTYPRRIFYSDEKGDFFLSMSMSCPSVLALINKGKSIEILKVTDKELVKFGTKFTNLSDGLITTPKGIINYFLVEPILIEIVRDTTLKLEKVLENLNHYINKFIHVSLVVSDLKYFIYQLITKDEFCKKIEFDLKFLDLGTINLHFEEFKVQALDNYTFSHPIDRVLINNYMINFIVSKEFYLEKMDFAFFKLYTLVILIVSVFQSSQKITLAQAIFLVERSFAHSKSFNNYIHRLIDES